MYILKDAVNMCDVLLKHIEVVEECKCVVRVVDKDTENQNTLTLTEFLEGVNKSYKDLETYIFNDIYITWDVYFRGLLDYMVVKNLIKFLVSDSDEDIITVNLVNIIELKKAIEQGIVHILE